MTGVGLKRKLIGLLENWENTGLPSSSQYTVIAQALQEWKHTENIGGLWNDPPVMLTATLDDGWGNGLKPIHLYVKLTGIEVIQLGVLQPVAKIVDACNKYLPDYLGLTILQFDSLEELEEIIIAIPANTKIIAGGPIFKRVDNEKWRSRGYYAAKDVTALLHFLLDESGRDQKIKV